MCVSLEEGGVYMIMDILHTLINIFPYLENISIFMQRVVARLEFINQHSRSSLDVVEHEEARRCAQHAEMLRIGRKGKCPACRRYSSDSRIGRSRKRDFPFLFIGKDRESIDDLVKGGQSKTRCTKRDAVRSARNNDNSFNRH